ncbi:unnamed protein product [Darwinula stevensoni]|uniref:Uncharacterized protein n=1 Tax=Darwinula stevensoni TaxID=69355 RepID=A0A7R9AFI2_9CRUS|nr:unnamed protein product [Darwinula stevensoni]CAG0903003.1 unnamed protein product [Darwinula stevensoni]
MNKPKSPPAHVMAKYLTEKSLMIRWMKPNTSFDTPWDIRRTEKTSVRGRLHLENCCNRPHRPLELKHPQLLAVPVATFARRAEADYFLIPFCRYRCRTFFFEHRRRPVPNLPMADVADSPTPATNTGAYKVYYTSNPDLVMTEWSSMMESSYRTWGGFTIISDLMPLTVYTVRVQAYTNNGITPISLPIQVKTQYRVPLQPNDLRIVNRTTRTIKIKWDPPKALDEDQEPLISYELYWNDTHSKVKQYKKTTANRGGRMDQIGD